MFRRTIALLSVTALAIMSLNACAQPLPEDSDTQGATSTDVLVIDTLFDFDVNIGELDPPRAVWPTEMMVAKALYDTLVTFADDDPTSIVANLAEYTVNEDLTRYTFTLSGERVFSDGTALSADDVVFSLDRMVAVGGSYTLDYADMEVAKVDEVTVLITTAQPSPQLLAQLAMPLASILNSSDVKAHGGTTDPDDGAQEYLTFNSAGSGPYVLDSVNIYTEVVLVKNPYYNGHQTPTYESIVIRHSDPITQMADLDRGDVHMALSLTAEHISTLNAEVEVTTALSPTMVVMSIDQLDNANEWTMNPQCVQALKLALNYPMLVELSPEGYAQPSGIIPIGFLGALLPSEALGQDVDSATAAADECGIAGQTLTLSYVQDHDDASLYGVLAHEIEQNLAAVGILVEVTPLTTNDIADGIVENDAAMKIFTWSPDYADPINVLDFAPGGPSFPNPDLRVWDAEPNQDMMTLVNQAYHTSPLDERAPVFENWARAMNASAPYIPLVQKGVSFAHVPSVAHVTYNPMWVINLAGITAV